MRPNVCHHRDGITANALTYNAELVTFGYNGQDHWRIMLYRLTILEWSEQIPQRKMLENTLFGIRFRGNEYADVAEQNVTVMASEESGHRYGV